MNVNASSADVPGTGQMAGSRWDKVDGIKFKNIFFIIGVRAFNDFRWG